MPIFISRSVGAGGLMALHKNAKLWPLFQPHLQKRPVYFEGVHSVHPRLHYHIDLKSLIELDGQVNFKKLIVGLDFSSTWAFSNKKCFQGLTSLTLKVDGDANIWREFFETIDVSELKLSNEAFKRPRQALPSPNTMYTMISNSKFKILDFTIETKEDRKTHTLHEYFSSFCAYRQSQRIVDDSQALGFKSLCGTSHHRVPGGGRPEALKKCVT